MKTIALIIATAGAIAATAASSAFAAPPAGHPTPNAAAGMMGLPAVADIELTRRGKVVQTIDANEYTYIEVNQGKDTIWLAAPLIKLRKNDNIRFDDGAVMVNFYSKLLKRTFPSVMFVNRVLAAN
jgi:hypothetical protein